MWGQTLVTLCDLPHKTPGSQCVFRHCFCHTRPGNYWQILNPPAVRERTNWEKSGFMPSPNLSFAPFSPPFTCSLWPRCSSQRSSRSPLSSFLGHGPSSKWPSVPPAATGSVLLLVFPPGVGMSAERFSEQKFVEPGSMYCWFYGGRIVSWFG
jgi:hypothetical protein